MPSTSSPWAGWAHPRSRGENSYGATIAAMFAGSSPLTRGKQRLQRQGQTHPGLIPAHAGKTEMRPPAYRRAWAHPRSRGENIDLWAQIYLLDGSSPLTRGKLDGLGDHGLDRGLIPAHAGKTGSSSRTSRARAAHPRSRGDIGEIGGGLGAHLGSSPLTRGKHFLTCAFIAQIDQILESLELCAFSESYSSQDVYATDAPRDRVRSIGLAPRSSRGAS